MTTTLDHLLTDLMPFIMDITVEDICCEPGIAFVYAAGQFTKHEVNLRAVDIENIAIVAAAQRRQDVGPRRPLLSTDLGGAGRLQVVLPPCVAADKPSITIRRGNAFSPTLQQIADGGMFTRTTSTRPKEPASDLALARLYREQNWQPFFDLAVKTKKTIVLAGETGSGKTAFAKGLIDAIPHDQRLISVEDTPEWTQLPHQNRVALYYDRNNPQSPQAADLVQAALRMRIGRLLLQEIRDGAAAAAFLEALETGHPGGITTIHAPSAQGVFQRLQSMLPPTADIMPKLLSLIDVVAYLERSPTGEFTMPEVWYGKAMQPVP